MVMDNSENLCAFNFASLNKFDGCKIYVLQHYMNNIVTNL